jgi:hypothetical protein
MDFTTHFQGQASCGRSLHENVLDSFTIAGHDQIIFGDIRLDLVLVDLRDNILSAFTAMTDDEVNAFLRVPKMLISIWRLFCALAVPHELLPIK